MSRHGRFFVVLSFLILALAGCKEKSPPALVTKAEYRELAKVAIKRERKDRYDADAAASEARHTVKIFNERIFVDTDFEKRLLYTTNTLTAEEDRNLILVMCARYTSYGTTLFKMMASTLDFITEENASPTSQADIDTLIAACETRYKYKTEQKINGKRFFGVCAGQGRTSLAMKSAILTLWRKRNEKDKDYRNSDNYPHPRKNLRRSYRFSLKFPQKYGIMAEE